MSLRKQSKLILLSALVLLVNACTSSSISTMPLSLNRKKADSVFNHHGNNIAILSCLRCVCFVDELNYDIKRTKMLPNRYTLLTDTNCNKFLIPVTHISSKQIEELSEDIYNLVFIKQRDTVIKTLIVAVEDSKKIRKIADKFFRN